MRSFNSQIKQFLLLLILLTLIFLSLKELYIFLPGLLGALTLYILSRGYYFQLVYHHKWKKGLAAGAILLFHVAVMGLLVFITVALLIPKISGFLQNPEAMIHSAKEAVAEVQRTSGFQLISENALSDLMNKIAAFIPKLLNSTINLFINLILLLFILYYMLVHAKEMEEYVGRMLPLRQTNINALASETKKLVRTSALGIPIISIVQGLTAMLGYYIFGVHDFVLWGFFTGVFAFFPVVGTMIIWTPLVLYMYADHQTPQATGLLLYSILITGNVDYLTRITLLKKWGDVHPVVTVLGVIVGLGLFGFIGFIFGPLLFNYIILVYKIYMNEFVENNNEPAESHKTY